jgi:voltage-gated potassium channel Kch
MMDYLNYSNPALYTTALYWAVTTITTVGYGDVHAFSSAERVYSICIMIIGVFTYSYTIGALSNLMANLDSRNTKLNSKLELLNELSSECRLSKDFY